MSILELGQIKEASTIDYPGEMVSVIYFCRCSFKCPFCQNWSLVRGEECVHMTVDQVITQLAKYRKFITGVCITGGEPTLQIEGLMKLLESTHDLGLLNKLDSNGFYSDRIHQLLSRNLVDFAAIDIKASFDSIKYGEIIGNLSLGEIAVKRVIETIHILNKFAIPYETRTTIIPSINDSEQEIEEIAKQLEAYDVSCYILQQFRPSGGTLNENFSKFSITDHDLLLKLAKIARKFIRDVRIRTIESGEEKIEL